MAAFQKDTAAERKASPNQTAAAIWQRGAHMSQVQGECGSKAHAKQKRCPQVHSGSQCTSPATLMARPQWGTLGHHLTSLLACDDSQAPFKQQNSEQN